MQHTSVRTLLRAPSCTWQVTGAPPAGAGARAELGLEDDFYSTSAGQRERALASTDRLGKTGDRIQNGRQQLLETEVRSPHLTS